MHRGKLFAFSFTLSPCQLSPTSFRTSGVCYLDPVAHALWLTTFQWLWLAARAVSVDQLLTESLNMAVG